jgi:flagellar basal-body rod protein FlgF
MTGIVEIGGALLSRTQVATEVAAQNLVNATTPGYKSRHVLFEALIAAPGVPMPLEDRREGVDFTPAKIQRTGNPLDLAILEGGLFKVRADDKFLYTRNGQFTRDSTGRLVTTQGYVLQSETGDVTIESPNPVVESDGVVLDNGEPVARIAVENFDDPSSLQAVGGGYFEAALESRPTEVTARLQQGAFETSNVSTAAEMLTLMAGLRQAESGQKLVQVYDDLMGRAITAFGQF